MNEILLNETQKVSATNHEAPEFLDSDYYFYWHQVDKMIIEETKEYMTEVSVRLNTKIKFIWD